MYTWNPEGEVYTEQHRLQITGNYFRSRAAKLWSEMEPEMKQIRKISKFKTELRKWIVLRRRTGLRMRS